MNDTLRYACKTGDYDLVQGYLLGVSSFEKRELTTNADVYIDEALKHGAFNIINLLVRNPNVKYDHLSLMNKINKVACEKKDPFTVFETMKEHIFGSGNLEDIVDYGYILNRKVAELDRKVTELEAKITELEGRRFNNVEDIAWLTGAATIFIIKLMIM